MPSLIKGFLRFLAVFLLIFAFALPLAAPARAGGLIRDAEVEATLRHFADPIFTAAGLSPDAIRIFIIQDEAINAFVAGGSNMFIHTGLILETANVGMLLGVMAHETGHIAGGHLAQGTEKIKNAQLGAVLSFVLGAAAAASGKGEAGAAILGAGQQALVRNFLSFSRSNENAADQAALGYLDTLNISSEGMLDMFEVLRRQENRAFGTPNPYARTHPLSAERISHIRAHVERSAIPAHQIPADFEALHARMVAKLFAFLRPVEQTFIRYPKTDKTLPARMARAVAYFRTPDMAKAKAEMQSVLKEYPRDGYLLDLYGQILFESGQVDAALTAYRQAAQLLPNNALIRLDLGKTLLATDDPKRLPEAIEHLERSTSRELANATAWRLLAIAYGKTGNTGKYHLALAEEAYLQNKPDTITAQVDKALEVLDGNSPARLRANDLKILAEKMRQDREDRE